MSSLPTHPIDHHAAGASMMKFGISAEHIGVVPTSNQLHHQHQQQYQHQHQQQYQHQQQHQHQHQQQYQHQLQHQHQHPRQHQHNSMNPNLNMNMNHSHNLSHTQPHSLSQSAPHNPHTQPHSLAQSAPTHTHAPAHLNHHVHPHNILPPHPGATVSTTSNSAPAGNPTGFPWSLGSTDGSIAALALMQQAAASPSNGAGADSARGGAGAGTGGNGVGGGIHRSLVEAEVSAGGIAIGATGEATEKGPGTGKGTGKDSGAGSDTGNGTSTAVNNLAAIAALNAQRSLYQERIFQQPSSAAQAVLQAGSDVLGFDISEVWLRTGPKTHQLTNSHLRPTALEDSRRKELVDVYYGDKSSDRTHRLSPALCKRAKDANDVVWVTAQTPHGAEALRCSISNVRTAVAVPVCHQASNSNFTVIFFSLRRIGMTTAAVEFLVHISIAAAIASVNLLSEEEVAPRQLDASIQEEQESNNSDIPAVISMTTQSEHVLNQNSDSAVKEAGRRIPTTESLSDTTAKLDLQWRQLHNVEYLTDGGNSWIHTAVFNGKSVVVKTLKPECQDVAMAINEIEGELMIHARLNHPNIVSLLGAGTTSKGVRFVVLERLDGGTLTQMLGYDTRIRDRRRRFWRKKLFPFQDVLKYSRAIAKAMTYCHEEAIPGSIVLHRDLKPDNIGFTLKGEVKILDFGLARIIDNASVKSEEVYQMSGETGSLRYMAPEVADGLPYNHKADVYSFGIIMWELIAGKKPFDGLNREMFYERIVHDGERPPVDKKWPEDFVKLLTDCWSAELEKRPSFREVVERIDAMLQSGKGDKGSSKKPKINFRRISGIIDRHSTWF